MSWSSARQANVQYCRFPVIILILKYVCIYTIETPVYKMQGFDRHVRATSAQQQAVSWSSARQANAQSRDFTVNSLMLDPFSLLIYDYSGGVKDCSKRVLRSIGSASESLQQDPVRILRAVRHAARCGMDLHALHP